MSCIEEFLLTLRESRANFSASEMSGSFLRESIPPGERYPGDLLRNLNHYLRQQKCF